MVQKSNICEYLFFVIYIYIIIYSFYFKITTQLRWCSGLTARRLLGLIPRFGAFQCGACMFLLSMWVLSRYGMKCPNATLPTALWLGISINVLCVMAPPREECCSQFGFVRSQCNILLDLVHSSFAEV